MKKILETIKNIFVGIVVVFSVCVMIFTIVSVSMFDQNNRDIFGFKAFIVRSDSMKGSFDAGDIIIVKELKKNSLDAGDIITFISQNSESYGETITHMIREKVITENGEVGFVTYGVATGVNDEAVVTYPYILGQYQIAIPKIGMFFNFLKTPMGYIIFILIPFGLLILYQAIKCIYLFRSYKKEQMEELEAERAKIAEERRESAELLKELQALKAQLAEKEKE